MVMTRKEAPGISLSGMVLVAVLLLTGWVATPAHSDQPDAKSSGTALIVTSGDGQYVVADGSKDGKLKGYIVSDRDDGDDDDDGDVEDRIERLEKQMTKLMHIIEEKDRMGHSFSFASPAAPKAPSAPHAPHAAHDAPAPPAPTFWTNGEKVSRTYKLSNDKMKALTELMVRDDVPIIVSPGEGQITVKGTAEQQAVFARFVRMIDDEQTNKHAISGGKLEALAKLMIRDDVPVRVSPGKGNIALIGSPEQQHIFANFVRMINGEPVKDVFASAGVSGGANNWQRFSTEHLAKAEFARQSTIANALRRTEGQKAREIRQALTSERSGLRQHLHDLRRQSREVLNERTTIEKEADQLRQKADQMMQAAEELRRKADELREQVDAEADTSQVRSLLSKLAQVEEFADSQELQGAELEDQVEAMVAAAEGMEWQLEALERQSESIEEAIENWPETVSSAASMWPEFVTSTSTTHQVSEPTEPACSPSPCMHSHEHAEPTGLSVPMEIEIPAVPNEPTEVAEPAKPADLAAAN